MNKFITQPREFLWDKGNKDKNFIKHHVNPDECEEIFFSIPIIETIPLSNDQQEQRYYAFGITKERRKLTIIFTLRNDKIRVISARDMSRKERREYEKRIKKNT